MFYRETKLNNYTKVNNYYLNDKRLSLKTKGFFTIILSLSDNWIFSNNGIYSFCKEGITLVNGTIKELKNYGYLKTVINNDEKGNFHYDYFIYEKPDSNLAVWISINGSSMVLVFHN